MPEEEQNPLRESKNTQMRSHTLSAITGDMQEAKYQESGCDRKYCLWSWQQKINRYGTGTGVLLLGVPLVLGLRRLSPLEQVIPVQV